MTPERTKEEILNEAAENNYPLHEVDSEIPCISVNDIVKEYRQVFIEGAKWQESQCSPVESEAFLLHLVDVVACFTAEQNMYYATPERLKLIEQARQTFKELPSPTIEETKEK